MDFCQGLEGVFLVSSEERAMGTQFGAIIDADNLYFLLVVWTQLDFVLVCGGGAGDGVS